MATGWTSGLIAPDMRVHDAAHAAIDSTGGSVSHSLRSAVTRTPTPMDLSVVQSSAPGQNVVVDPANAQAALTAQVLNNPSLGSRTSVSSGIPRATPVGSASVSQNTSVPSTIQAAVSSLNNVSQNNNLASILNQILHGVGAAYQPPSPEQTELYKAQTRQINQQTATQGLPGQLQNQINALQAANPPRMGVSSITPALPGQYNPATDNALQNLYGQLNFAKQAASGWITPVTY